MHVMSYFIANWPLLIWW